MGVISKIENQTKAVYFQQDSNKLLETIKKIVSYFLILTGISLSFIGGFSLFTHSITLGSALAGSGIIISACGILNIKRTSKEYTTIHKRYDLTKYKLKNLNKNKFHCYQRLTKDGKVDEISDFYKIKLNKKLKEKQERVFQKPKLKLTSKSGGFNYDKSTFQKEHWTANFADSDLFGYAHTSLLAQDELQVLEHPGIYHLRQALKGDLNKLSQNEIALIKNVKRKGQLSNIYGNTFAKTSTRDLDRNLTIYRNPHTSNIFAMAAPSIPSKAYGKPYSKADLEKLFYSANTAFKAIKQQAKHQVVCHTGNWGAGAFGGSAKAAAICQIVAARNCQLDELIYYSMNKNREFQQALELLNQIEGKHPNISIDKLLTHVSQNAKVYNLLYGISNNT